MDFLLQINDEIKVSMSSCACAGACTGCMGSCQGCSGCQGAK